MNFIYHKKTSHTTLQPIHVIF